MSNLDDRLEQSGAAVRRFAATVPQTPPDRIVAAGRRQPVGLIVAASLTLVVALAATLLFLSPNRGSDMVGPDAPATSVSIPDTELPGDTSIPPVAPLTPIRITCNAEVSEGFECRALFDGDPNSTWRAPNGGIGGTVTLLFATPVQITDVTFENEGNDAYIRSARVRGVAVTTDDLVAMVTFELPDTNDAPQRFEIRSLSTTELTIEFTSAYPGQSFGDLPPLTDLALGEITVNGRHSPVAPETRSQFMIECLASRGFYPVISGVISNDGPAVVYHPAPDQVAAFEVADGQCLSLMEQEFGVPGPVDYIEFYRQLLETAECLVREGYDPPPAPTLQGFLEQVANPGDDGTWHPYQAVNPGPVEWVRINRVCPQP